MGEKHHLINVAEITKMLKDHNSLPTHITKEALTNLVRLVNIKIVRTSDLTALDFPGF